MESQFNDLSPPNPSSSYFCSHHKMSKGFTHLMKLVLMVNPDAMVMIESLLKNTDEINKKNDKGWTALMLASANSNTHSNNTIVKMLIDAKPNVNHDENDDCRTALMYACNYYDTSSNIETIKILLDAGANPNKTDMSGYTALMQVYRSGYQYDDGEVMKMLIDAGADVNFQSIGGFTVLMFMCSTDSHYIDHVKLLVNSGTDINIRNSCNESCLSLSVKSTTTNFLIDSGANVNDKFGFQNQTLLMKLLDKDPIDVELIIRLIHLSKKTLLHKDDKGRSAFDFYLEREENFLDEYHVNLLKGITTCNNTKSARI